MKTLLDYMNTEISKYDECDIVDILKYSTVDFESIFDFKLLTIILRFIVCQYQVHRILYFE